MKIALVTDAWLPQVNGVVTTLVELAQGLARRGHEVVLIEPSGFRRWACPGYREIELAWRPARRVARWLDEARPDAVHIATEGPLGGAARAHCLRRGWAFTTAFHTRFPDILAKALHLPQRWGYAWFKRFHAPSSGVMVPTGRLKARHADVHWRGVLPRHRLAAVYSAADVFVFPSRSDTFGLVMLEAMACGTPVAAYPVPGPLDVLGARGEGGCLHHDLRRAALQALDVPRSEARARATGFAWQPAIDQFIGHLVPVSRPAHGGSAPAAGRPACHATVAKGS